MHQYVRYAAAAPAFLGPGRMSLLPRQAGTVRLQPPVRAHVSRLCTQPSSSRSSPRKSTTGSCECSGMVVVVMTVVCWRHRHASTATDVLPCTRACGRLWQAHSPARRKLKQQGHRCRTAAGNGIRTATGRSSAAPLTWTARSSCCLLYTSPSPRDVEESRMPSSA